MEKPEVPDIFPKRQTADEIPPSATRAAKGKGATVKSGLTRSVVAAPSVGAQAGGRTASPKTTSKTKAKNQPKAKETSTNLCPPPQGGGGAGEGVFRNEGKEKAAEIRKKAANGSLPLLVGGGQGGGSGTPNKTQKPPKDMTGTADTPVGKRPTANRKPSKRITVYVARGGPARGQADYEQAFPERRQALDFLSNQHGLTTEEQRQLAKTSRLKLNRRWHGSEACALRELALDPDLAARVLRGESAMASS